MLRLLKPAIGILFCFSAFMSIPSSAFEAQPQSVHLQRVNILVSDIAESRAFYEDILGLTLAREGDIQSDFTKQTFAIQADEASAYALLSSAEQPRVLGLVHVEGRDYNSDAHTKKGPQIVLRTSHMNGVIAKLSEEQILVNPSPLNNFDGEQIGREMAILDPDGYRIILFEMNTP